MSNFKIEKYIDKYIEKQIKIGTLEIKQKCYIFRCLGRHTENSKKTLTTLKTSLLSP